MKKLVVTIGLFFLLIAFDAAPQENEFIGREDVRNFIKELVKKYQFDEKWLVDIFKQVKIRPKVIQKVRFPLESKPWYTYRRIYVTDQRILDGIRFWEEYQTFLNRAEEIYGVPASIIVATIGIESRYGKNKGYYPVIDALVNLAFSETRPQFFRKELEEFLLLTRELHLDPLKVMGSYAGAIGQPQFMPSSFRYYAVNFSGHETIDLSNDVADVIGSIANYYHKNGWWRNKPIAFPVSLSGGKYQFSFDHPKNISLSELIEKGEKPADFYNEKPKLIVLTNHYGNEYWYGFHNFDVIKRYNHSELYAMAVYQLSYHLTVMRERYRYAKND